RNRTRSQPFHGLVNPRKINLKYSAASQFAVNPDESSALLHHPVDGGQSKPRALALRLRREKRLKNMRLRFRAHPRSRVGDTQNYVAALADNRMLVVVNAVQLRIGCLDNQLASIRHGVARVDH